MQITRITGQKALCFLSAGISAGFIWRDTDSSIMGWKQRDAEVNEGDNMTLGIQSWGLQPGGLGGKLEGSPCPGVMLGKYLEGAASVPLGPFCVWVMEARPVPPLASGDA